LVVASLIRLGELELQALLGTQLLVGREDMGAIHANTFTNELYRNIPRGNYLRDKRAYSEDQTERVYKIYNKRHEEVVSFRARPLPGCCGVLVVYYLRPNSSSRKSNTETFQETLTLIVRCAGLAKFGNVLLTQTTGSAGYDTLVSSGSSFKFTNWKTRNDVVTFQITTTPPPADEPVARFEGE